ncbi:hypothetical protein ACLB2K_045408 [Fragaria x ananassa]
MLCTTSSISLEASKRCSRLLFWTGERLEAFTSSSTTASATTSSWDSSDPKVTLEQAVRLCDRNFGIGADGVIFTLPGINDTDYNMRIFNSNGSEPEMCGNGVRCFARFITEIENLHGKQRFTVHTGAGLIVPEIADDGKVFAF